MAYDIGTILYATDLGPRSLEVFQHAVGIARRFGAKMHVVTCIEAIGDYANVTLDTYVPAEVIAQIREDGIKRINEEIEARLNRHDAAHPDNTAREVIASIQIIEGNAAEVVLSEQKRLAADGIDRAQFRKQLREQLMLVRVRERDVNQKIKVSELEIDQYLREQQKQQGGPQSLPPRRDQHHHPQHRRREHVRRFAHQHYTIVAKPLRDFSAKRKAAAAGFDADLAKHGMAAAFELQIERGRV